MKIDNTGNSAGIIPTQTKRTRRSETEGSATAPEVPSSKVRISSEGSSATKISDQVPESFDAEKVKNIRDQLLAGAYQPDASQIAGGMIKHLQGLL